MPLDPLLANPATVKFADSLEQYTNFLQAQHLKSEIDKAKRAEDDDTATNNAFKSAYAQTGLDEGGRRNALLGNLAQSGRGKLIPGFQKQFAETDKSAAEAGKFTADTTKANVEATAKELENVKSNLAGVSYDPSIGQGQMFGHFVALAKNPVLSKWIQGMGMDPEEYVRTQIMKMKQFSTNPEAFKQFVQQEQMGVEKTQQLLQQASEKQVTHLNLGDHQTLVQTNKYGPTNPQVVGDYQGGPKVPQTNINVNNMPENKANAAFGEGLGKMNVDEYKNLRSAAEVAQNAVEKAQRIRELVKAGAFTGAGAQLKTNVDNALAGLGFTPDPRLSPSQELQKYLANNVFDQVAMLKNSGVPISRLTNVELELAKQGAPSQNLTADTIDQMMQDIIRASREATVKYNGRTREFNQVAKLDPAFKQMALHEIDIPGVPKEAIAHLLSDKSPKADQHFDEAFQHPGLAKLIRGGTSIGGAPFSGLAPPSGGTAVQTSNVFPTSVERWRPIVEKYARMDGVDPELVLHIMNKESGGDPLAHNGSHNDGSWDHGLMQVNSIHGFTKKQLEDPDFNIRQGIGILAGSLKAHKDLRSGIKGYNGSGPAADAYAADILSRYKPKR